MKTIEYARYYVKKGFSVIPLENGGKKPAVSSWKEYQGRRPTDEELSQWFENGSKNNIGIITGAISGIVVVDLDSDEAVEFSKVNSFPETPKVKTGKGYHLYYANPKDVEVRNFQQRDGLPDIDLRGDGGYVVAPPSLHESGQEYGWIEGRALDDLPLAKFPELLLVEKPQDKTSLKELDKGVEEGKRNISLARLAGSWVNYGLNVDECLENARIWNQKNKSPLEIKEVEGIVRSIFNKHRKDVFNSYSIYSAEQLNSWNHGGSKNHDKNGSDYTNFDPSSVLLKGSDLINLDIKVEWLIDKLIPKESITILHGKGGIGKTWLSLVVAEAVSKGNRFMDLESMKVPVVFVDFENSLPVLVERVKKINASDVFFWHNTSEVKPPKLDSRNWELYRQMPVGLLIFDTLRASQDGDENNSQDMQFIMSKLKELRDMGFTILLLHHTPKGNDRTYKGSTAIFDLSDHVLSLHRVKKYNLQETDDNEDEDSYFRFGTKDKTRYEPYHIFLEFDKDKGFVIAPDPDIENIKAIYDLLKGKEPLNQLAVFKLVKEELEITNKQKVLRLLKKGEGKYWTAEKKPGQKGIFYNCSTVQHYSNKDNKTDDMDSFLGTPTILGINPSWGLYNGLYLGTVTALRGDARN
jgi:archaellum biogenesis ATPase FlaH